MTFWSLALHAHMVEAFLHLARLFDTKSTTLKLRTLIDLADQNAGNFQKATPEKVRDLVERLRVEVGELQVKAKPILNHRNRFLAHLDPKIIADFAALEEDSKTTFGEMEGMFESAGEIVNEIYGAYRGGEIIMDVSDWDDFRKLLRVVERGIESSREDSAKKYRPIKAGR